MADSMDAGDLKTDEPKRVTVQIGGQSFEVDESIATAMEAQNKAAQERERKAAEELDAVKATVNKMSEPKKKEDDPPVKMQWGDELWEKPEEVLNRVKEQAVEEAKVALRKEYRAEKNREDLWGNFYATNKELDNEDGRFVVEALLGKWARDGNPVLEKDTESGLKELAEAASKKLIALKGDRTSQDVVVEGGSHPALARAEPVQESNVKSLKDVLEARRKRRYEARVKHG